MNKYFTPDISDIRVGYECEIKTIPVYAYIGGESKMQSELWIPYSFTDDYQSFGVDVKNLRVTYLTKEQIEAEGWEMEDKEGKSWILKKDNGLLYFECSNFISILEIKLKDTNHGYFGQCKDINTFRYITKLLGI